MKNTKSKILASALKLFNEHGLVNVRLQHISDDAIISVGNIAYHFKNKEAILNGLYKELVEKQLELLSKYRQVPLFENINALFIETFEIQQTYLFFYFDILEILRSFPSIGNRHQKHVAYQIAQLKSIIDFNQSRGVLRRIDEADDDTLAALVWQCMDFWMTHRRLRSQDIHSIEAYLNTQWNLLIPYFSAVGFLEYGQMNQQQSL